MELWVVVVLPQLQLLLKLKLLLLLQLLLMLLEEVTAVVLGSIHDGQQ